MRECVRVVKDAPVAVVVAPVAHHTADNWILVGVDRVSALMFCTPPSLCDTSLMKWRSFSIWADTSVCPYDGL